MLQPPLPRDDSPTNNTNSILSGNSLKGKETLRKEEDCNMPVHHGGKVGKAGKTLARKGTSKVAKSKASTTLANHKAKCHSK